MSVSKAIVLILTALVITTGAVSVSAGTNDVLAVTNYDLAELVFQQYTSTVSNQVFLLNYGTNSTPLQKNFVSRFNTQGNIIRSDPSALMVVSNKFVLDKTTRKEAIALDIIEIHRDGDKATARLKYFASGTVSVTKFYLTRKRGKWSVSKQELERIADAF